MELDHSIINSLGFLWSGILVLIGISSIFLASFSIFSMLFTKKQKELEKKFNELERQQKLILRITLNNKDKLL